MAPMVDDNFWKNKKVFLTGHTGFKGSWMALWLQQMGANVCGYSLKSPTEPSLFEIANVATGMKSIIGNVCDYEHLKKSISDFSPEIVIHMAAQALVRYSYQHPIETFQTNVMGAVNILDICKASLSVKVVLNVTTDKCYENKERLQGYREDEPMGGFDPYSSSKGCSELVTASYRQSFFEQKNISLASARAGNVIGGGDWALDRLVPDLIRCLLSKEQIVIRNPQAIRPWQHVLEPLSGYLILCQAMYLNPKKYTEAYNLGPNESDTQNVEYIVKKILNLWGDNLGYRVENANLHEAHYLKLDCAKVKKQLGWSPQTNLDQALKMLVDWYQQVMLDQKDARLTTLAQIKSFHNQMKGL